MKFSIYSAALWKLPKNNLRMKSEVKGSVDYGEDLICQDPEDIDPDKWFDKGELTKLPEAPLGKAERRYIEPSLDQRNPKIPP